jgi:hypothetical protein
VIVDVFTGHYQATHVPSHNRCIATAIDATILFIINYFIISIMSKLGNNSDGWLWKRLLNAAKNKLFQPNFILDINFSSLVS